MSRYIYGFDFGTTNSALSIIDTTENRIIKTFNEGSLIYFPEVKSKIRKPTLKYFIGKEAVEHYVENEMSGRFMKSIKRILPRDSFKETRVFGKIFKADDLVSLILIHLKTMADDYIGEPVNHVVLGRPVVFDKNKDKDALAQQRLLEASKKAGFEQVFFQMEPIAAAFTYEREIKKEELVLVGDFGGGTTDFTLMQLSPNKVNHKNRTDDILAKGGIYIGGDNFDSSIMWHKGTHHFGRGLTYRDFEHTVQVPLRFYHSICSWEEMNFFNSMKMKNVLRKFYYLTNNHPKFKNLITLVEKNLGYSIFQSIEQTKFRLSKANEAHFAFSHSDISIDEMITLDEFSSTIIHEDVLKIKHYLQQFLQDLNITPNDIDAVFTTGGTSLVKPINEMITQIFGQYKIKSGDNFNSVANGLAYSHSLFFD
jgi:hypothetical chaperone protein